MTNKDEDLPNLFKFYKDDGSTLNKIEIISEIRSLQEEASKYKQNNDYDKAIALSEKVIRYAIKYQMDEYISEQEKFMNQIALNVEKSFLGPKIKQYASWLLEQYDKLIENDAIYQAHDLVKSFKNSYKNVTVFSKIPEAQEIIEKDRKTWLKFELTHK